jgi:hypothetical protein
VNEAKNGWNAVMYAVGATPNPVTELEQNAAPTHLVMVSGTFFVRLISPLGLKNKQNDNTDNQRCI